MSLILLKQAIQQRKSISFEYNKEGKINGTRFGNPHAVFIMRKKDNSESTKTHIVQTAGVSDSEKDFPDFRLFDITEITNVQILDSEPNFTIDSRYNPSWDGYAHVIAKV
ncbi:hypothetical protein PB70LOC_01969 [Pectobacterium versatile]|uniref:hypothetical protein n=2 Tax=Pectobacterium versatile TaxID=2488639 RepID=UPI000CDED1C2|nr:MULTISPECIES: hypothetical protein [Pectobacterium]MBD0845110.1 hypothetical protein [Pectobacterium carotovorum subsp. carotovorum]MBK4826893.1 hypothetical protein [Pectobacterium carotovorum subsp. carotovorum]POY55259.1 hypothetical protein F018LOC_01185 [Pectobacterium versatile]POY58618.1 hypothetical protein PB70LOC_01969 [Pectobacterium versatile]POY62399.1 hypothetical protein PB69LOC_03192 [Pectobacterium versatile]